MFHRSIQEVYKSLQNFVVKFARKIWRAKDVPADWAQAFIVLLSKSNDLASLSEFRPIAMTSTIWKIFFSVLAERLQFFMHMIKTILFQERSKKVFQLGFQVVLNTPLRCLKHCVMQKNIISNLLSHGLILQMLTEALDTT